MKTDLLKYNIAFRPTLETSYPIAEEIVNLIQAKKISYAEAYEALDIAKEGIKTLILGN